MTQADASRLEEAPLCPLWDGERDGHLLGGGGGGGGGGAAVAVMYLLQCDLLDY